MNKDKQALANNTPNKDITLVPVQGATVEIPAVKVGERFWRIRNTNYFGRTKEELKNLRRQLNAEAGVDETKEPETNAWPYRVTKGPDHPHNKLTFGDVSMGKCFSFNGTVYRKTERDLALTFSGKERTVFAEHTPVVA